MEERNVLKMNDDDDDEDHIHIIKIDFTLWFNIQLVNRNRGVVGANCVRNSDGKIVVEEDRLMEVWRAHYDVLSNDRCE